MSPCMFIKKEKLASYVATMIVLTFVTPDSTIKDDKIRAAGVHVMLQTITKWDI